MADYDNDEIDPFGYEHLGMDDAEDHCACSSSVPGGRGAIAAAEPMPAAIRLAGLRHRSRVCEARRELHQRAQGESMRQRRC